jgi:hypothetical protein
MWDNVNLALTEATRRVLMGLANFLPGLLALLVALLLSLLAAWIIGSVLRRSLRRVEFDERLNQWGLAGLSDWSPSKSPTLLVTKVVT